MNEELEHIANLRIKPLFDPSVIDQMARAQMNPEPKTGNWTYIRYFPGKAFSRLTAEFDVEQ